MTKIWIFFVDIFIKRFASLFCLDIINVYANIWRFFNLIILFLFFETYRNTFLFSFSLKLIGRNTFFFFFETYRNIFASVSDAMRILSLNTSTDTPYVGDTLTIQCCLNTDPRGLQVQWLHNGTAAFASSSTDVVGLCYQLNISNVQYKDSGMYECKVSSDRAHDEKKIPVSVRGKLFFP